MKEQLVRGHWRRSASAKTRGCGQWLSPRWRLALQWAIRAKWPNCECVSQSVCLVSLYRRQAPLTPLHRYVFVMAIPPLLFAAISQRSSWFRENQREALSTQGIFSESMQVNGWRPTVTPRNHRGDQQQHAFPSTEQESTTLKVVLLWKWTNPSRGLETRCQTYRLHWKQESYFKEPWARWYSGRANEKSVSSLRMSLWCAHLVMPINIKCIASAITHGHGNWFERQTMSLSNAELAFVVNHTIASLSLSLRALKQTLSKYTY